MQRMFQSILLAGPTAPFWMSAVVSSAVVSSAAAVNSAGAADYAVGDLVVAVADAELKIRREGRIQVADRVFPGATMRVGAVNGRYLWVSNGVPGWIKAAEVIPLDDAIDYFTKKIEQFPKQAKWRYARAVAWTNKGEMKIAIADYTELIRLQPTAAYYHVRGICYHAEGEYAKAISDFNEAIRMNPKSARYLDSRSESWHALEEYARAIEDCEKAIHLEPNLVSAYTNRGRAREKLGQIALAADDYRNSIRLDPNYELGYTHLAWLQATSTDDAQRDGASAVKYAQKACELTNWQDPHAIGTLAAAQAEAGNFDEAIKWEQKAQSMYAPDIQKRWAFLLDLYKAGKPYRQGMEEMEKSPE